MLANHGFIFQEVSGGIFRAILVMMMEEKACVGDPYERMEIERVSYDSQLLVSMSLQKR